MSKATPKDIAKRILSLARKQKRYPRDVLADWINQSEAFDPNDAPKVMIEIGRIGGKASSKAAKVRRRHKEKEQEKARQFNLLSKLK